MKSKVELLEELITEKGKALIQVRVHQQERARARSFSSFGINASDLNEEFTIARELEAEITALRGMRDTELEAAGQLFTGTKEETIQFLSSKGDSGTYKVILLKKEGTNGES